MTQIDEKAYTYACRVAMPWLAMPWLAEVSDADVEMAIRHAIEAYEAAKAPRTISREELDMAVNARQGYLIQQYSHIADCGSADSRAMQAALATLGITVGD